MSDQYAKDKHSKRLHADETHVRKRTKLIKEVQHREVKEPHKLHKVTGMNCGNPHCVLCMNPRKSFGEMTIQEKKFYQERLYDEREVPASIHEDGGDIRQSEYSTS